MTEKNKSIRATFLPDWRAGNPYQDLLAESLRGAGAVVDFFKMPRGFMALNRLPKSVLSSNVIHLHWVNDLIDHILWPQNIFSRALKLCFLYIDVALLRLRGVRVVWTIHNLVSHESVNIPIEIKAREIIAKACSHIFVHSRSALDRIEKTYGCQFGRKASVIPNGNYDGCYEFNDLALKEIKYKYKLSENNIHVMFFGAVRRYKGVHHLVDAFLATQKTNLRLIVAGKPNTADLTKMLEDAAAADSRIILIPEFIPDDQVAPMFAAADAVAIPFERTLNSGSVVLAMTMAKATLLPVEAKVFDLVDDTSSLFFNSLSELTSILNQLDKRDLIQRGINARRQADSLDWEVIGRQVYEVYEEVLKN